MTYRAERARTAIRIVCERGYITTRMLRDATGLGTNVASSLLTGLVSVGVLVRDAAASRVRLNVYLPGPKCDREDASESRAMRRGVTPAKRSLEWRADKRARGICRGPRCTRKVTKYVRCTECRAAEALAQKHRIRTRRARENAP